MEYHGLETFTAVLYVQPHNHCVAFSVALSALLYCTSPPFTEGCLALQRSSLTTILHVNRVALYF